MGELDSMLDGEYDNVRQMQSDIDNGLPKVARQKWPSGQAADCNSAYVGSTPSLRSIIKRIKRVIIQTGVGLWPGWSLSNKIALCGAL